MYKEIESHNLEGFRRVFNTFRKKAISLGMPEPSYKVVAEKYRKIGEMPNCNVYSKVSIVELDNVDIMVNGWQIVALIEPILKSDANAENEDLKLFCWLPNPCAFYSCCFFTELCSTVQRAKSMFHIHHVF